MISLRLPTRCPFVGRVAPLALLLALGCEGSPSESADPVPSAPVFGEDFESAATVADLFPSNGTGWHGIQIVPDLNEVDVTTERSRTGTQSLRFAAIPGGSGASKADIYFDGLALGEGDEAWFEWWVWLEAWDLTESMFLWDLEAPATCTDAESCPGPGAGTICNSPGRRLYIGGAGERLLTSDLGKWCVGDLMEQNTASATPFSVARWVRLRVHMVVSSGPQGRLQVWQDRALVIDAAGITLPRSDAVYTRMQIGITQNQSNLATNVIFVDDVRVWLDDPVW